MKYILIIGFLLFFIFKIGAQEAVQNEGDIVRKAHKKQLKLEDFVYTEKNNFKAKVFAVEYSEINKTHHWFVQILTSDNLYVNFGSVEVIEGYLKTDPSIPFVFMNPVMSLCNEGKYIIGFVNVKLPGVYVLNLAIENFGTKDRITVELEIMNEKTQLKAKH